MILHPVLALDVGTKTCGLAITDPMGVIVQPLPVIRFKGPHDLPKAFESLIRLLAERSPKAIVYGVPFNDQESNRRATYVRDFVSGLKKRLLGFAQITEPTWHEMDESFTTVEAESFLQEMGLTLNKRKQNIDSQAAALILKRFLEESF